MGIFYSMSCNTLDDGDANARALSAGYPELGPVMALSALALDMQGLRGHLGDEHFTLLEILVTSAKYRGRGVGAGIVTEIMSE